MNLPWYFLIMAGVYFARGTPENHAMYFGWAHITLMGIALAMETLRGRRK